MRSLALPFLSSPLPTIRLTFRRPNHLSRVSAALNHCRLSADPDPFVAWFGRAWPYVRAHRGSTFVVVIGGEVVDDGPRFDGVLQDLALLHGLGIRLVIVPSTNVLIERVLEAKGRRGDFVGPYRVTDAVALDAAMEASGKVRLMVEARLSPGPSMLDLRRHGDYRRWHEVGVSVLSGNFLAAKRRGVVEGIDFGATGEVKKLDISRIYEGLDKDCIVLLSNLGYSSSGQVLNCNSYEVATACALAIEADKLICIIDGQILDENGDFVPFMSLQSADLWIRKRYGKYETAASYAKPVGEDVSDFLDQCSNEVVHLPWNRDELIKQCCSTFNNGVGFDNGNGFWNGMLGFAVAGDHSFSRFDGYISELAAAAFVCRGGIQRVHLVDGTLGGSLLLELFTRDGVGTLVASDAYECTRVARETDILGIKQLLQPLKECGALIPGIIEELEEELSSFTVVERDGSIIACAAFFPHFEENCGEIAAFAVSPDFLRSGQGGTLIGLSSRDLLNVRPKSFQGEEVIILNLHKDSSTK